MKSWRYFRNLVMAAYWEMELERTKKEMAVIDADIASKQGDLKLNVERKVRLEKFVATFQRHLDKLRGENNAEQESGA